MEKDQSVISIDLSVSYCELHQVVILYIEQLHKCRHVRTMTLALLGRHVRTRTLALLGRHVRTRTLALLGRHVRTMTLALLGTHVRTRTLALLGRHVRTMTLALLGTHVRTRTLALLGTSDTHLRLHPMVLVMRGTYVRSFLTRTRPCTAHEVGAE